MCIILGVEPVTLCIEVWQFVEVFSRAHICEYLVSG